MTMVLLKVRIRNLNRSDAKKRATYALLHGLRRLNTNTRSVTYIGHLEEVLSLQETSSGNKFTLVDSFDVRDLVRRIKDS
jgi:hypothetical protein